MDRLKNAGRGVAGISAIAFALLVVCQPAIAQPKLSEAAKGWTYVGNSQCKICHNNPKEGAQWDAWKKSKHATALELLKSDAAKEVATKAGITVPPDTSPKCLKCHITGYDEALAAAPEKIVPADSVQCESCHGPASEHTKDGKVLKLTPAKISEVDIKAHITVPSETMCVGCHNDSAPSWKNDRYTLADGTKVGFDFKQAWEKIKHEWPEGYIETKYAGKFPKNEPLSK